MFWTAPRRRHRDRLQGEQMNIMSERFFEDTAAEPKKKTLN